MMATPSAPFEDITVRVADVDNAGDVDFIHRNRVEETLNGVALWEDIPPSREDTVRWLGEDLRAGTVLIAEAHDPAEDEPIRLGWAALGLWSSKSGYRYTREVSIYADPQAQGRGVGTALMRAVIEQGRKGGFHLLVSAIESDNAASIRLHERFGFTVGERIPHMGRKCGRWLDLTIAYLQLEV